MPLRNRATCLPSYRLLTFAKLFQTIKAEYAASEARICTSDVHSHYARIIRANLGEDVDLAGLPAWWQSSISGQEDESPKAEHLIRALERLAKCIHALKGPYIQSSLVNPPLVFPKSALQCPHSPSDLFFSLQKLSDGFLVSSYPSDASATHSISISALPSQHCTQFSPGSCSFGFLDPSLEFSI